MKKKINELINHHQAQVNYAKQARENPYIYEELDSFERGELHSQIKLGEIFIHQLEVLKEHENSNNQI